MEPRIQYAKTSDGVSIAYAVTGQGPPLVVQPWGPAHTHLELEWGIAEARRWYQRLAEKRTVIRLDYRGSGLSERNIADFSLDNWLLDLEAVTQRLKLDRFALFGGFDGGLVAVAYAARHPEQVSDLVVWCSTACRRDITDSRAVQAIRALWQHEWDDYAELVTHMSFGWSEGDLAHRYAPIIRDSTTQGNSQKAYNAMDEFDVSELLPNVRARTLVMHRRDISIVRLESGRALAMGIPDASFRIFEGRALAFVGDWEPIAQEIVEFLEAGQAAPAVMPAGMTAILFADIADSTGLTERLGDSAFREKARELDGALRTVIRERAGTPIEGKLLGDGVLAVFTSAREAIEAALACADAGNREELPLHLGLHAGDVIREDNNVYGGAVNIASRIAGLSAAGEVLVSETVRSLARTSAGVRFEDRGEQALKGVGEKVRVWAVVEAERSPSTGSGRTDGGE